MNSVGVADGRSREQSRDEGGVGYVIDDHVVRTAASMRLEEASPDDVRKTRWFSRHVSTLLVRGSDIVLGYTGDRRGSTCQEGRLVRTMRGGEWTAPPTWEK